MANIDHNRNINEHDFRRQVRNVHKNLLLSPEEMHTYIDKEIAAIEIEEAAAEQGRARAQPLAVKPIQAQVWYDAVGEHWMVRWPWLSDHAGIPYSLREALDWFDRDELIAMKEAATQ